MNRILAIVVAVLVAVGCSAAYADWVYVGPTVVTTYYPPPVYVYPAPAPVVVARPVLPAPVVVGPPVPVVVGPPAIVVRPVPYVRGQPVRNAFRALVW